MTDGWTLAAKARNDFADMIDALTPEQVGSPTLCTGWSAHLVAAHVVTFVDVPLPKFMFNVMKARGDFDAAADNMARKIAERPTSDLVATIRAKASKKSSFPTFPGELTATDTLVHTQDVRRALDLPGAPAPELVTTALDFLTTDKKAKLLLEEKGLLDGLRLEATDVEWSHGEGALVRGTGEALVLAMVRRPVFDELTGDGVDTLKSRHKK